MRAPVGALLVSTWLLGCACETPEVSGTHREPEELAARADPPEAEPSRAPDAPRFRRQRLGFEPFSRVDLWAPPAGSEGAHPMLVLLYGNQGADENPTWMVDLRTRPELRGYVLVAPALGGDDYRWDAPAAANGVARLVESIVGRFPIDPGRITLLGYSAGGSRVLSVARRVERPVSVVSVAGDIGRAVRAGLDVRGLEDRPVLLVCNSEDHGPNASCELDERNAHLLGRRGFTSVERRRRVGDHRFDMRELAPLVAAWLEPDTTGAPAAPPSRATKRAAPIGDP